VRPARLNSRNQPNFSGPKNLGGAPKGNRNALKHGKYTGEVRALYAAVRMHVREGQALIALAKAIDIRIGRPRIVVTEYIRIKDSRFAPDGTKGSVSVARERWTTRRSSPTGCG
jgi:hypothetical protein